MSLLPDMTLIADSLGWAVLHSFWQGMVAAGIVFAVRNMTREQASELRYFTGIITLCALLFAFMGTFLYYYNTGAALSTPLNASETVHLTLPSALSTPNNIASNPLIQNTFMRNPLTHLSDFTGLIGLLWTLCFAVLGVRYLSAFRLTHKLRNQGLSDLDADWHERFMNLVKVSGVSPKVRAYFSEHVSSPITFGFLKPIVLLPAWFFTSMTPEQCEAVILHELAHIRRHDYLTNILQIIIKTVFFYHPAVGFICKGLDTDREHACDDFSVMLTKNPEGLATALGTIRLKAARGGGVFALSADGHDAPLMHRLKRLMGTSSSQTGGRSLEKGTSRGIAATAMMGSALALVMTLGATSSQAHPQKIAETGTKLAGACETCEAKKTGDTTSEQTKWDSFGDIIMLDGHTYNSTNSTAFPLTDKDGEYYTINGKKYPSKYRYSVYAKNGKNYVVKEKNGKRYLEIDGNWYRVDKDKMTGMPTLPAPATPNTPRPPKYAYGHQKIGAQSYATKTNIAKNRTFIKVRGKWHDIDANDLDVLLLEPPITPVTPVPPVVPATPAAPQYSYGYTQVGDNTYTVKTKTSTGKSYVRINGNWLNAHVKSDGKDHGQKHIKINGKWYNLNKGEAPWVQSSSTSNASTNYWVDEQTRAAVEAELERAEDRREAALERAEDKREAAMDRAEDEREAEMDRREAGLERAADLREAAAERKIEQKMAAMERKIEQKQRALDRAERKRVRDIARIERKIRDKEAKFKDRSDLSPEGIGQLQSEIGRLQSEIGRLQGQNGYDQGELGQLQAKLGHLQGELGHIQGERGAEEQKKYFQMRDKLIPLLKADGYMKTRFKKATIEMTPTDIFINGKQLSEAQESKYCNIISDYMNRKDSTKKIVIKPGYLFVAQKGGGHNGTFISIDD